MRRRRSRSQTNGGKSLRAHHTVACLADGVVVMRRIAAVATVPNASAPRSVLMAMSTEAREKLAQQLCAASRRGRCGCKERGFQIICQESLLTADFVLARERAAAEKAREDLLDAHEAGWQRAVSLAIARIGAYEHCADAISELERMAETGAHDPGNAKPPAAPSE